MLKDDSPFISVVIPAYNEEKYLNDTLKSVLDQEIDSREYEVIVVDNNSTDKTYEVAKSFKVRVVQCKTPGVSHARQAGAKAAIGEIIVYTDADTKVPRDWILRISRYFKEKDIVALTGTASFNSSRLNNFLARFYTFFMRLQFFLGTPGLNGFNCAIKKSVFDEIGGINTELSSAEDVDLGIRASKMGKVIFAPEISVVTSARRMEKSRLNFFWQHLKNIVLFTILGKKTQKFDTIR